VGAPRRGGPTFSSPFSGGAELFETVEGELLDDATVRIDDVVTTSATVNSQAGRVPTPRANHRDLQDAEVVAAARGYSGAFAPANDIEAGLLAATESGDTDAYLSALLRSRLYVPVPAGTSTAARPADPGFPWQVDQAEGRRFICVFTSAERLNEHLLRQQAGDTAAVSVRFVHLIGSWPDPDIFFAINPGSPVGATLPGSQILELSSWASEVGLAEPAGGDLAIAARKVEQPSTVGVAGAPTVAADQATPMQRVVLPAQLPFYLERGYDRVSGFVYRASELLHLSTPKSLYRALGLLYPGSPCGEDDTEVHFLRWSGHRANLYRIPYGGQHEAAMRAMQGWVIERAPFRGNGFAPSDTDVVAEFKVDSVRLPHGAQMWRLAKDGTQSLVATFDSDTAKWIPQGGGGSRA
jgi:hypothetical protein